MNQNIDINILYELTPFEQQLKSWYEKHHSIMPWELFLLKEKQIRQQLPSSVVQTIDPCYEDYKEAIYDHKHGYIDLKNITSILEKQYIMLIKQPRYFPEIFTENNMLTISYVYSGDCIINIMNENKKSQWHLKKGDFFFSPVNFKRCITITSDNTLVLHFLLSEEILQQMMINAYSTMIVSSVLPKEHLDTIMREPLIYQTKNDLWVQTLIEKMVQETLEKKMNSNQILYMSLNLLITYIQREYKNTNQKENATFFDTYAPAFTDYITENYKDFSMEAMAAQFHLSPSHISRLYKKYTGQTIRCAVQIYRIRIAKYLLLNTTESIEQIANHVGYRDVSYFIEIFRKETKYTPKQYRSKSQKE